MPELPEVETLRRDLLSAGICGETINNADIYWDRTIRDPEPSLFRQQIRGKVITGVYRRGKYLSFVLDGGLFLLVHLRMTGGLSLEETPYFADTHDRVIFNLGSRRLVFHDTRKFGRMQLTREPEKILNTLGPEPFDPALNSAGLRFRLKGSRRSLKALLLDQSVIAGLGNIYTDESLFAAGLNPARPGVSLSEAESERLLGSIRVALLSGIENRGTSLGDGDSNFSSSGMYGGNAEALKVFRRTGQPCFICGTPILRVVLAQRSTHYCPVCQPGG